MYALKSVTFMRISFAIIFLTSLTFQVYSKGSGDIAIMGTIVTCAMKTYISSNLDSPVEASDFEQFKIGEGDGVPG